MSIEDYEFGDFGLGKATISDGVCIVIDSEHCPWFALYKDDAIAIAKHFKLTEEDLK